jgi:hypothetical protein
MRRTQPAKKRRAAINEVLHVEVNGIVASYCESLGDDLTPLKIRTGKFDVAGNPLYSQTSRVRVVFQKYPSTEVVKFPVDEDGSLCLSFHIETDLGEKSDGKPEVTVKVFGRIYREEHGFRVHIEQDESYISDGADFQRHKEVCDHISNYVLIALTR